MSYVSHTQSEYGVEEPVREHLLEAARLCGMFMEEWGGQEIGIVMGIFHDLGKYSELFQKVLLRQANHVDHAAPGAYTLVNYCKIHQKDVDKNLLLVLLCCIAGHHYGLRSLANTELLPSINIEKHSDYKGNRYATTDCQALLDYINKESFPIPAPISLPKHFDFSSKLYPLPHFFTMLFTRFCFSALVDADYTATDAHFRRRTKDYEYGAPIPLHPQRALSVLESYRQSLRCASKAKQDINTIRDELYQRCLTTADQPKGLFTLTSPTGSGKTLAMLAFALKHAHANHLKRIIIVLPFLNIIEQTTSIYRSIFTEAEGFPVEYIFEDHSNAAPQTEGDSQPSFYIPNWDSPIIITTTIKFFECLFEASAPRSRHIHNIANSVILFDEAQTLPHHLCVYSLSALSVIRQHFGASVVFSTATQPAFHLLHGQVSKLSAGWRATELIDEKLRLFERAKRLDISFPDFTPGAEAFTSFDALATEIADEPQALVIVNTRKQAKSIIEAILLDHPERRNDLFHLSTNLCLSHRKAVLQEVRERLNSSTPLLLVATQCVEAGVDLDFPLVYRAMAPMDAIIQASGRCNRNGGGIGFVKVFCPPPEDEKYPNGYYKELAYRFKAVLMDYQKKGRPFDINSPSDIRYAYEKIFSILNQKDYSNTQDFKSGSRQYNLINGVNCLSFTDVADHYYWIDKTGSDVIVPYDQQNYDQICELARAGKLDKSFFIRSRETIVNLRVSPYSHQKAINRWLEPVCAYKNGNKQETGTYILTNPAGYDSALYGLQEDFEDDDAFLL